MNSFKQQQKQFLYRHSFIAWVASITFHAKIAVIVSVLIIFVLSIQHIQASQGTNFRLANATAQLNSTPTALPTPTLSTDNIQATLTRMDQDINDINKKLEHPPKDIWDKISAISALISGILIAIIGIIATHVYRQREMAAQSALHIAFISPSIQLPGQTSQWGGVFVSNVADLSVFPITPNALRDWGWEQNYSGTSWSPDDKFIVFSSARPGTRIVQFNQTSGNYDPSNPVNVPGNPFDIWKAPAQYTGTVPILTTEQPVINLTHNGAMDSSPSISNIASAAIQVPSSSIYSQKCADLYSELYGSSRAVQPLGPQPTPNGTVIPALDSQMENPLNYPLEYYEPYHQSNPYYKELLTYEDLKSTSYVAVPCAFKKDGRWLRDGNGNVVIRFTSTAADYTHTNNSAVSIDRYLRLLNYADYFAQLGYGWCSPYQTVEDRSNEIAGIPNGLIGEMWDDALVLYGLRNKAANYGSGYNIPAPAMKCPSQYATDGLPEGSVPPPDADGWINPCGSFAASVYRAMHLYLVDNLSDNGQRFSADSVAGDYGNVIYGPQGIDTMLSRQKGLQTPNVYWSSMYKEPYQLLTVYGVHNYNNGNIQRDYNKIDGDYWSAQSWGARITDSNPALGKPGRQLGISEYENPNEAAKLTKPDDRSLDDLYQRLWQQIKPGDMAINITESGNGKRPFGIALPQYSKSNPDGYKRKYEHIEIVVGWGYYDYDKFDGTLYSSYQAIVDAGKNPADYLPYVMDRGGSTIYDFAPSTVRGTANGQSWYAQSRGPRPYDYAIKSTSVDFWIANFTN